MVNTQMKHSSYWFPTKLPILLLALFVALCRAGASENVAHEPFAQWADVPDYGQLIVRATYEESDAYHFWAGNTRHLVDFSDRGEH